MRKLTLFIMAIVGMAWFSISSVNADVRYKRVDGVLYDLKLGIVMAEAPLDQYGSPEEWNYSNLPKDNISLIISTWGSQVDYVEFTAIANHAFEHMSSKVSISIPSSYMYIGIDAFRDATGLESVTIYENQNYQCLQAIGARAFRGCTNLSKIKLPNTFSTIPRECFYNCVSLNGIEIPTKVDTIGHYAFSECKALTSVKGSASDHIWAREIQSHAFDGCTNLRSIKFSASLKSIYGYAFKDCASLEQLALPANLDTIGEYAFANSGLKDLTTYISTPLTIPANVFYGVELSNAVLHVPAGCKAAYKAAPVWCKFGQILEPGEEPSAPIDSTECVIGQLKYKLNSDLTATVMATDDNKQITGSLVVPETIEQNGYTYLVTAIEKGCFSGCSAITSITLPNSITRLEQETFKNCTNLKSLSLPVVLDYIGSYCFYKCSSMTNVDIPFGVKVIDKSAFFGCSSLYRVEMPASLDTIAEGAFWQCTALMQMELPQNLRYIGSDAFALCHKLDRLVIPESVDTIGEDAFPADSMTAIRAMTAEPIEIDANAFGTTFVTSCILYVPQGCKAAYMAASGWNNIGDIRESGVNLKTEIDGLYYKLSEDGTAEVTYETVDANNYASLSGEITVPGYITYDGLEYKVIGIGTGAFANCTGITKVNLPQIEYIRQEAFQNCSKLNDINIPTTIEVLYDDAFEGTPLYTQNIDADGAVYYDKCMLSGPGESYTGIYKVKEGTRLMATYVLNYYSNITSIVLPEGLQHLCVSAIANQYGLKTISLPSSIQYIGNNFVATCSHLDTIYNYSKEPYDLSDISSFSNLNKDAVVLCVPYGCKAAYEAAEVWKDFYVIEMEPMYTVTFVDKDGFPLKTQVVEVGASAKAPEAPEVEGYTFTGWSTTFNNVQSDLTVTAQYTRNKYRVRFIDYWSYAVLKTDSVEHGCSATPPTEVPEHEGYVFVGWDAEYDVITCDLSVESIYVRVHEGIEQTESQEPKVKSQKFLRDGMLYIKRNGRVYDAHGALVE